MRKFLALILSLALISCSNPFEHKSSTMPSKAGKPMKASVSGAKGIFLASNSSAKSIKRTRGMQGRDLVASSGASLGAINLAGIPETVTWTDANGIATTATVSQAMQLATDYLLLTYASDSASGTATLNLTTGALASISVVPDNWSLIFARGSSAWYESGGAIYRMDLATGGASIISSGSNMWNTNTWANSGSSSWNSQTWIYADANGIVYAFYAMNSSAFQAMAISSSPIDFGNSRIAWNFYTDLPGSAASDSHFWAICDPASNNLYLLENYDIPSGAPDGHYLGVGLRIMPVTLDPTVPGVITIGTTALASSVVTTAIYGSTNIAQGTDLTQTLFSNGPQTWTVSMSGGVPMLTSWDTSAVPLANNGIIGQVLNWQYSGGCIYAGPNPSGTTPTVTGISIAQFGTAPSVSDPVLVSDSGIISWSVVGGVLFYTTSAGTFEAPVNTSAGTIGTAQAYSGGQVQAVTR